VAIVLPNEGLPTLLEFWTGKTVNTFSNWNLVLFKNNYTPIQTTVYADLILATFGGYSPVVVDKSMWTTPTMVGNKATTTYTLNPTLWTVTSGSETIYGAALVTPSSPRIMCVERWVTPVPVAIGGLLGYLPRLTFTTDPSP